MTDRSEAEKAAREALDALVHEPAPRTVEEWNAYIARYQDAQRNLGKALGS